MFKTTKQHKKYWESRKIDWNKAYFSTWTHPHRILIINYLRSIRFGSLYEIGCAAAANLFVINQAFPRVRVGGCDVNNDALREGIKHLPRNAFLQEGHAEDLFMSDKSTDVVLTDMMCIYLSPRSMNRFIKEAKRITRSHVIFVEFNSESLWERLRIWWETGYYVHNFRKLLAQNGFYDVIICPMKEQDWPGGGLQPKVGAIITAKI